MLTPKLEHLPGIPLPLVRGESHACPYLPDRNASNLLFWSDGLDDADYQWLMDRNFRRSGTIFYRPSCGDCRECIPIRVPVAEFAPSKSQRRAWRKNTDVAVEIATPTCDDERLDLYRRYQSAVHDKSEFFGAGDYERFLVDSPVTTLEFSYRLDGRLIGVGIVDATPVALSSVYFIYDPVFRERSLGTFSALREIEECGRRGLPYWYLGLYVRDCAKMVYKASFRPFELLRDRVWHRQTM
ncbi:MAG: arginyltransferase [Phycisphaerae bacterium]